jgi:hypothetical protein
MKICGMLVIYLGLSECTEASLFRTSLLSPRGNLQAKQQYATAKIDASDLEQLRLKIVSVEVEIEEYSTKINKVEEEIVSASSGSNESLTEHLRMKELELRRGQNLLREKEKQLRDEEFMLLKMSSNNIGDTANPIYQLLLEFNPLDASKFVASQGRHCISCLYNGMKAVTFNYPDVIRGVFEMKLSEQDIKNAATAIREGLPRDMFPVKASETKNSFSPLSPTTVAIQASIEQITGKSLQLFFTSCQELKFTCASKVSLTTFGANNGPASQESKPDILVGFEINGKPIPVIPIELKDTTLSPIEQTGQAFSVGANIALMHRCLGLDSSKIAVPLIMTNGALYLFAMVSLLDCVPVLHLVSNIMDASSELVPIARLLATFKAFIINQAKHMKSVFKPAATVYSPVPFARDKYFLKNRDKLFNRFSPMHCERGALPLLWDIFEALSTVEGVVKPLGYGEFKFAKQKRTECAIVFNDIKRDGYVMGVPQDEVDYTAYVSALESLVHQIHACKVIHMDLYPCNIMWAKVEGALKIRIVDWDAASFMDRQLSPRVLTRIVSEKYHTNTDSMPSPKYDAWHVFILSNLDQSQRESLDAAKFHDESMFVSAHLECIKNRSDELGSDENLHREFSIWYEEFESRGANRR